MELRGPIRVASINEKKYILVIVDDYSRFTWIYFLHTKDETPEIIKKFIAQVQLNYGAKIHKIRTDNCTDFKNATLKAHYEKLGIMQQFSTAQNASPKWYNKTPYELLHGRKPNVEYFHVFGSLCYPTNDRDDLGKMKPKADIGIFIGYSKTSRVHNHEDSPSTSSIIVEEYEAPPIVTTSEEQTSLISLNDADGSNQEDSAEFDGNMLITLYDDPDFIEAKSSTALDSSNMLEFYQVQPSTHIWTKAHPLEQVIGDPSKPVIMSYVCMH
ncbi:retrovirus-related pol polyprotein from transposon TNT 1-94 [Tanacetum coccineum]